MHGELRCRPAGRRRTGRRRLAEYSTSYGQRSGPQHAQKARGLSEWHCKLRFGPAERTTEWTPAIRRLISYVLCQLVRAAEETRQQSGQPNLDRRPEPVRASDLHRELHPGGSGERREHS